MDWSGVRVQCYQIDEAGRVAKTLDARSAGETALPEVGGCINDLHSMPGSPAHAQQTHPTVPREERAAIERRLGHRVQAPQGPPELM